jgi:p21-activated kinase 1
LGKGESVRVSALYFITHSLSISFSRGLSRASGSVFTAYRVATNLYVAIKKKNLTELPEKDLIIKEILVMRTACHVNIINYIDWFLYHNDVWIVMEYMGGGSLRAVIKAYLMTEGQMAAVSKEIAQGLQYLHKYGIIHRDITSDNVLLSLTGDVRLGSLHELFSHHDHF